MSINKKRFRTIVILVLVLFSCVVAAQLGEQNTDEKYNYTLADFCYEDGSVAWHTGPKSISADEFEQYFGFSYEENIACIEEIVKALENERYVPDNEIVFNLYGFRAFGGPVVHDENAASGAIINIIDDGQNDEQWMEFAEQVEKDAVLLFKQGFYLTSLDEQTRITIVWGSKKRLEFILFDYV